MSSTLTTAEIAQMRADVEDVVLPDKGVILSVTQVSDGQGGFTDTWGTAYRNVKCRLDYVSGMETVYGGAVRPFSGWALTLPYDTTITTNNRFLLNGDTYSIIELDTDKSWNLFIRARVEKL